jgi:phosphate uptake regulator
MKRKLIQLSTSTKVVSLPSKWIKQNNLKKGAEINLETVNNAIMISAECKPKENKLQIDISDFEGKLVWTILDAIYISGYDIVELKTKDIEQSQLVSKAIKHFLGFIVFDERKDKIILKDISKDSSEDINSITSRIFYICIDMLEDIKNEKDKSLMKKRDYLINSYTSYCMRLQNKYMHNSSMLLSYFRIIEMIADKICIFFAENDVSKNSIQNLQELFRQFLSLHTKFSMTKLKEVELFRKKLESTEIKSIATAFFELEEIELQLNI